MNTISNKKLVIDFLENLPDNTEKALEMMSENGTWWTATSGSQDSKINKVRIAELFKNLNAIMTELHFVIIGTTAENDRVAVECETNAKFNNGGIYNNVYHLLFEVSDGRIQTIKEYNDTAYAQKVLAGYVI